MTDKIIKSTSIHDEQIKKSLFISVCNHISSTDDFFHFLELHKDTQATHNCWAYRIGNEYRFNDDGEPSGTAGKPILAAIDGSGFNYLGALVIRHYGGIKLGTGGLARAYGGVTARNLQQVAYSYHVPKQELDVQLPFEFSQSLYTLAAEHSAQVLEQKFNTKGMHCIISIPTTQHNSFKTSLNNITKGQACFIDS